MNILLSSLLTLLLWNGITPVPSKVTLYFAGDVMQHKAQIENAFTGSAYNYDNCFEAVRSDIITADVAIGNLEVTLGGKPYTGYPAFSAPDELAVSLRDNGFDVLATANNHCLDRGRNGLIRTLNVLDSLGLKHFGTYRSKAERDSSVPLIVNCHNQKIALLGYTYDTNGIKTPEPCVVNRTDTALIAADIRKTRTMNPDCIIVYIHWGIEYETSQSHSQKQLAEWLINNGVNHIIGTHPHVVQPVIITNNAITRDRNLIVYSLGNYISNMSAPGTDHGLAVTLTLLKITGSSILYDYRLMPLHTERPYMNNRHIFRIIPDY